MLSWFLLEREGEERIGARRHERTVGGGEYRNGYRRCDSKRRRALSSRS
jgi:hypothetical protein